MLFKYLQRACQQVLLLSLATIFTYTAKFFWATTYGQLEYVTDGSHSSEDVTPMEMKKYSRSEMMTIGTKSRGTRLISFLKMSSRLPFFKKFIARKRVDVKKKGPIQSPDRRTPPIV
jgi:hypothetical protein